jgi:hypothetical protein
MTMVATSRCPNARSFRRSAIGHGGARSNTQLGPQFVPLSPSLNAAAHDPSELLMYGNAVDHHAQPPCLHRDTTSAALKSP